MKQQVSFCAAAACGLGLLLAGCATTQQPTLQAHAPVAVVSVYGNSSIPWYEEQKTGSRTTEDSSSGGMFSGVLNRTLNKGDTEIETVQERIDGAAATLVAQLESRGVAVVPQQTVAHAAKFQKSGNSFMLKVGDRIAADGYKVIERDATGRNRQLAAQTGAGSVLYAEFTFNKEKRAISLTEKAAFARVQLDVYVAGADGRKLLAKKYVALSADGVEYHNGRYDRTELCGLFPDTVAAAVSRFLDDFAPVTGGPDAGTPDLTEAERIPLPPRAAPDAEPSAEEAAGPEAGDDAAAGAPASAADSDTADGGAAGAIDAAGATGEELL